MKHLHIVHIIPTLGFGGAERFVVSLATRMSRRHVRHSIITLWDLAPLASELSPDVTHVSFSMNTIPRYQRVSALKKMLVDMEADIVHTHLFSADLWGRLACKQIGIPVVTTEHNLNISESWLWHRVKRAMRRYSRSYTAPSRAVATYMHTHYRIPMERIHIIPHGIDTHTFMSTPPAPFRAPLTLGMIGRIVTQKGHRIALDALRELHDMDIRLLIVGNGELRTSLEHYAKQINVHDRVIWRDAVHDVTSVYRACDIILVPSLWEGLGIVILEAMASDRLVIASYIDGIPEIITHNQTGVLVPPGDAHTLADAIRAYTADARESKKIARQGRQWVRAHAHISDMVTAYEAWYLDIGKKFV